MNDSRRMNYDILEFVVVAVVVVIVDFEFVDVVCEMPETESKGSA